MLVSDIYPELQEVTGETDLTRNLRTLQRAIELLSNKGILDPLVAVLEFNISGGYYISLPRDVKAPLRININGTPSFARNRLFEYSQNTDGTVDGEEVAFAWADRGYLPISDERPLPGQIAYLCSNIADNGATCLVVGRDVNNRVIKATLIADSISPIASTVDFCKVDKVVRVATQYDCFLQIGNSTIAQYYPDETEPEYRVIKISKTAPSVKMLYRKHIFKLTSLTDIIPLNSVEGVLRAARAVRYLNLEEDDKAAVALQAAVAFIQEEQDARDVGITSSEKLEVAGATNNNISVRDSIIVADIYDEACSIVGPIGRPNVFDKITTAVEMLANQANWDAMVGYCDIVKTDNTAEVNPTGKAGNGYFVLPSYVGSVLALNMASRPQMPRNKWFEFHMNGWGYERNYSDNGTWDDLGEVVVLQRMPLLDTGVANALRPVIPMRVIAVCDSALDNGTMITVYGYEIVNGIERPVEGGFVVSCNNTLTVPGGYVQRFSRIERIVKAQSSSFISLFILNDDNSQGGLLGYWMPDETEPKYRAIKVACGLQERIRIRYRKRWHKFKSLYDPIHLRSRAAITAALRAGELMKTDPQSAEMQMQMAVNLLNKQQWSDNPSTTGSLQFDTGSMPGVTSDEAMT